MKKSLLLAALLLSSAAQAETWVCSTPFQQKVIVLSILCQAGVRFFLHTNCIPETQTSTAETWDAGQFKILVETDAMLTLARISPDGRE
jgi:hypothetical protein